MLEFLQKIRHLIKLLARPFPPTWSAIKKTCKSVHSQSIIAFATLGALIFSGLQAWNLSQQTQTLRQQMELENRPFLSIENVYWQYKPSSVWLTSDFRLRNYGEKPAEEFQLRNYRVIIFEIKESLIEEKIKEEWREKLEEVTGLEKSKRLRLYKDDERGRLTLHLMRVLADFFRANPDARQAEVKKFLDNLGPASPELKGNKIFVYKKKLLFRSIEVNNEMEEYFREQRRIVSPKQAKLQEMTQEMGEPWLKGILDGKNLLVVHWAIQYRDILSERLYSTFYIGFNRRFSNKPDKEFISPFVEFQSWSAETDFRR